MRSALKFGINILPEERTDKKRAFSKRQMIVEVER